MIIPAPRIIAEIGTSHSGDLERARDLIAMVAEAGADTAKFQLVRAAEILHPQSGSVDLPGGVVPLYERFRELEREASFYQRLKEMCSEAGIRFLCTPFGIESARMLRALEVEEYKVASPELNHMPLLREIASYQKPVILSTGVARLRDIAESLDFIWAINPAAPLTLLHCITSYPAPEEEFNLRVIPSLASVFGIPVGLSDHSMDPVLVPVLATIMGAVTIEKHITVSRSGGGLDDPIALDVAAFATMVREVRETHRRITEAQDEAGRLLVRHELLREMSERYGNERVEQVLGDGVKRLSASEQRNYGFTNRSIHVLLELPAGTVITPEVVAVLRSEKNLTPGLHPRFWEVVMGRTLARGVRAGEGLRWRHLLHGDGEPVDSQN